MVPLQSGLPHLFGNYDIKAGSKQQDFSTSEPDTYTTIKIGWENVSKPHTPSPTPTRGEGSKRAAICFPFRDTKSVFIEGFPFSLDGLCWRMLLA
ncbi:hypothetical protein [Coleofasciculus chthonoplastes]|uniref:hypothetical protein n=1 Tax=Coleofasciculus chthonoplastes TaxID=64178 RepID=UPI003302DB50